MATRENALFLSTAVQLNSEQLQPLFRWFHKTLLVLPSGNLNGNFSIEKCRSEADKQEVLGFLKAADLSIAGIDLKTEKWSEKDLPEGLPDELKKQFLEDMEKVDLRFLHQNKNQQTMNLDFEEESQGTKKLFALAGPWLDILEHGRLLVVDELEGSLHPLIVRYLLERIQDPEKNRRFAQLIFTTHNTLFLDRNLLRGDQVWLLEPEPSLASQLYPLTDFRPRKGEALEKGYLRGRYGALPFMASERF